MHDPAGTPVVIDWRAPVSRPFYRASRAQPMGLDLRRRFGFSGGDLTAFEDERFTAAGSGRARPGAGSAPAGEPVSRILINEIERPRSGPMRDIVATIQPDQDDIVRADVGQTVCVQGAPGTGKTAVGLHRVAYLLYAYKERVARRGVLVIGPNRAFLGYIRNVLPALGEIDVSQLTVTELAASVPVRGQDSLAAARVKGDARMAEVLRRAVWSRLAEPPESLVLARGARRWRVSGPRPGRPGRRAARPRPALRRGPGPARAPDRARDPEPDGGGRGVLRRPDPRRGAAHPPGARRGRHHLAQGGPGAAGVRAAQRRGRAGRGGQRGCSTRPSSRPSSGPGRRAAPGRRAGHRRTWC